MSERRKNIKLSDFATLIAEKAPSPEEVQMAKILESMKLRRLAGVAPTMSHSRLQLFEQAGQS